MKYLHTMLRVTDLERSLKFYVEGLGFTLVSKNDYPEGKFTLVFLRAPAMKEILLFSSSLIIGDKISMKRRRLRTHGLSCLFNSRNSKKYPSKRLRFKLGARGPVKWKISNCFIDDPDGYEIELIERKN